ncbi:putative prophage repressor,Antitoxin PezA,transcriptional repressor DicA,Predicted transcriptional regulator,Helix-turn-helix domain [[Clostridium] sordellii]|uniref:helix-turn-helix domain-containing protein n=1 Tax=Paraclostridium sordellii TaxID=1505 RepID=UPI000542E438|nr:helix-turn-helix transcriptional regulator [Paeniclostridium sordellii]CEK34324.1 putative prophage repressor,Antitoxin PezA,transcriptional repressor DicA,Predicted transcriptional regulator,Helix-turn-helix domain [[Clostridium] sordellii] [Paeniclostridium sordellii]
MNLRLKEIRKSTRLKQADFAKRLNISRSHLAGLETGAKPITERIISDLCKEYNVNKEWFLTGDGDMFNDPIKDFNLDPEIEEFLQLYLSVDEDTKKYVKGLMKKTISK